MKREQVIALCQEYGVDISGMDDSRIMDVLNVITEYQLRQTWVIPEMPAASHEANLPS
jgi:hypothetical protein